MALQYPVCVHWHTVCLSQHTILTRKRCATQICISLRQYQEHRDTDRDACIHRSCNLKYKSIICYGREREGDRLQGAESFLKSRKQLSCIGHYLRLYGTQSFTAPSIQYNAHNIFCQDSYEYGPYHRHLDLPRCLIPLGFATEIFYYTSLFSDAQCMLR